MSLSNQTTMLPDIYQFSLNLMIGLPNLAIIADVTKNNGLNSKDKMIVYALTFTSMLLIVYSKSTMPLGLLLSIIAIIFVKKNSKDINCILYTTLLSQNILIGTLMTIQYMIKDN
ncbi:hypothetical protein N8751_00440 [bacterium]|nr:hypothetical protein [bacterium]